MALEQKTLIDQIEILRDGTLRVRMNKTVVDGETVIASGYHRTVLTPGVDADVQLAAVNGHLAALGAAPVEDGEWDRLRRIAAVEHTPAAVASWRQKFAIADDVGKQAQA